MNKLDFQYILDCDYDYSCRGQCYPDDYCRCATYENLTLEPVTQSQLEGVTKHYTEEWYIKGEHMDYCLDRLFRFYKGYDPSNWYIGVENGYYGEEIGSITFDKEDEFRTSVKVLLGMKPNERIEQLLFMEYGSLPDTLKGLEWSVEKHSASDIMTGDTPTSDIDNMRALKARDEVYEGYTGIIGLVTEINGRYKLIDGHHRLRHNIGGKNLSFLVGK